MQIVNWQKMEFREVVQVTRAVRVEDKDGDVTVAQQ